MPRISFFPTLYSDLLQLSMTDLKRYDLLETNHNISSTITWSRNGNKRGAISIEVDTINDKCITFDYQYKDEPQRYKIEIVHVPSNLGKGMIPFFKCTNTNKLCRKLYSFEGYFQSRESIKDYVVYESQNRSKTMRSIEKNYGPYFNSVKLYHELGKKYFKKTYAGKPTKRYLKIREQLDRYESMSLEKIQRLFIL